jgi:pyruvate/2-oxoglutarate dehydrogenase complex dihydrolipoamide dehydrogenase (E3) component
METYDVIIIGAGQAGDPLSTALAKAGKKTAVIEEKYVGGTCINVGCTPTKTMVASAEAAYLARRGQDYGVFHGETTVDLGKVRQRKEAIVQSFREGSRRLIVNAGASLIEGHAWFNHPKQVEVKPNEGGESRLLTAPVIVINAGARPTIPNIDGMQGVPYLDSTSIMELEQIPEHLLIIGGGYVALEFGQMFRRFGSRVTIFQKGSQLLAREDEDVAQAILGILRQDGIEVLLNADVQRINKEANGTITINVKSAKGERAVSGSHVLTAVGRTPNSDRLNLPAAGIKTDPIGNILTDDRLETNVAGVFALGDIKGGPAFTHISYDDYRILKTNLIGQGGASTQGRLVPYTVFTDPQLGRIGLTEKEARGKGLKVQVAQMPMSYIARAIELDRERGLMKAVVAADSKQILGAAILGYEGGELMAMIEIAMMGKLPYTALRDGIFAHPTLAESFNNLFASLG